jgi:hypothetical protein
MTRRRSTDDLIQDLARRALPPPFSPALLASATLGLMALCLWLFLLGLGLRADLYSALQTGNVQAKSILPLALFAIALGLALASARPGVRVPVWLLGLPVAAAAALVAYRLATMGAAPVVPEFLGQTALACLTSITALSALPLAAGMWLMRRGAPTRPGLSGALLGLAVGAGIAAGYALHCTEDSPLFFVLWYGLAMSIPAAVGGYLGRRVLHW